MKQILHVAQCAIRANAKDGGLRPPIIVRNYKGATRATEVELKDKASRVHLSFQEQSMNEYSIVWEIQVSADNPEDAARRALAIQRDPDSTATVFEVNDEFGVETIIDLDEVE